MQLTANPDGCRKFDPNPFKREKCKSCGHPWTSHLGAIDDAVVQGHLASIRKAALQKRQAEEAAKAKEREKKLAKRKQNQAVEDDWLFDGSRERQEHVETDSSDDDMGFKMFIPDAAGSGSSDQARKAADTNKPLVVRNLIDFGECDVPEDPPPPQAMTSTAPPKAPAPTRPAAVPALASAAALEVLNGVMPPREEVAHITPRMSSHGVDHDALHEELEHLRQMLQDANEEKNIQVAIVRDEVLEKQQVIEDLIRQRDQSEASLKEARGQIEALTAQLASAPAQDAAPGQEEAQRAMAENERLRAELATAQAEAAEAHSQVDGLRAEKAELAKQLEAALAAASAAERVKAENGRLAQQLEVAKAAAAKSHGPESFDGMAPEDSYRHAEEVRREVAETLRDMRKKADSQLAWIARRMRESHLDLVGQPLV